MKKLLIASLLVFFTTSLFAQDTKKMSIKEKMQRIMKMQQESKEADERIAKAKAKTKAVKELRKTVDKLANTLGVD